MTLADPTRFPSYRWPEDEPLRLELAPELASWNRADSPDQLRLARFLDHADALLGPRIAALSGPLALALEVGLAPDVPLIVDRDLDNYLLGLARRTNPGQLISAWASKSHRGHSRLVLGQARTARLEELEDWGFAAFRAVGSYERAGWKEGIAAQAAGLGLAPPGALWLQVTLRVSPLRAWTNLWKPVIDALGPLLGARVNRGRFDPDDGRITRLGLHRVDDPDLGWDVEIGVRWRAPPTASAPDEPPGQGSGDRGSLRETRGAAVRAAERRRDGLDPCT